VLRVAARVGTTRAEGPGLRYALWLQGCSIRCPGCCNPHLFAPLGPKTAVAELLAEIAVLQGEIEGVTVLGGEPFDQAGGLLTLVAGVEALGLSRVVFSGFTLEELKGRGDPVVNRILATIDVLVDGRYDSRLKETERLWVGSSNQNFHYLTRRYSPLIERPSPREPLRSLEVRIGPDGRLNANGWPERIPL